MIQLVNSHIRRLTNEKAAHEKDMEEAKEKFKFALSGILAQCKCVAWNQGSKVYRNGNVAFLPHFFFSVGRSVGVCLYE